MRTIKERTEDLKQRDKTVTELAVEKVSEKIGNATSVAQIKSNLGK